MPGIELCTLYILTHLHLIKFYKPVTVIIPILQTDTEVTDTERLSKLPKVA